MKENDEQYFIGLPPVETEEYFIDSEISLEGKEKRNKLKSNLLKAGIVGAGVIGLSGAANAASIFYRDEDGVMTDLTKPQDLGGFLLLDQTTPQTVTGGQPTFSFGLVSGNATANFNLSSKVMGGTTYPLISGTNSAGNKLSYMEGGLYLLATATQTPKLYFTDPSLGFTNYIISDSDSESNNYGQMRISARNKVNAELYSDIKIIGAGTQNGWIDFGEEALKNIDGINIVKGYYNTDWSKVYGLKIEDVDEINTDNYAIKTGLGKVSLGGNVLIGTSTDDGLNKLQVDGNAIFTGIVSINNGSASSRFKISATDGGTSPSTDGGITVGQPNSYGTWQTPSSIEGIVVDNNLDFSDFGSLWLNYYSSIGVGIGQASEEDLAIYKLIVQGDTLINGDIFASNLSGTNTGDQDLSGLLPKSGGAMTGVLTYASPQVLNMQPVDAEPDAVDMVEGCIYFVVEDV